jgi:hypothetical protein
MRLILFFGRGYRYGKGQRNKLNYTGLSIRCCSIGRFSEESVEVKATTKNTILIWGSFFLGSWFGLDFERESFSRYGSTPFPIAFGGILALLVARLDIFGVHTDKILNAKNSDKIAKLEREKRFYLNAVFGILAYLVISFIIEYWPY